MKLSAKYLLEIGAVGISVRFGSLNSKVVYLILESGDEIFIGAVAKWGPAFTPEATNLNLVGSAQ